MSARVASTANASSAVTISPGAIASRTTAQAVAIDAQTHSVSSEFVPTQTNQEGKPKLMVILIT